MPAADANLIVAEDIHHALYGIRASDGKQLWRRQFPGVCFSNWAVSGQGVFLLREMKTLRIASTQDLRPKSETQELVCIHAQTGKARVLTPVTFDLPVPAESLFFKLIVDGDDLFIVTPREIRAYDCRRLLAAH